MARFGSVLWAGLMENEYVSCTVVYDISVMLNARRNYCHDELFLLMLQITIQLQRCLSIQQDNYHQLR